MSKVYLVLGIQQPNHSGSMTFPEDFTFIGVHKTRKLAQDHCDLLNEEEGAPVAPEIADEEGDDTEFDGTLYEVEELDVLGSVPKKTT